MLLSTQKEWPATVSRLAVPFVVLDAVVELATEIGVEPSRRPSFLAITIPPLITLAAAVSLWKRWFPSWAFIAAHGILILFAWFYVLVLPSAPESQAVRDIYVGAPLLHSVLGALRDWYAPLSGAAYVALFTHKRMRDFIDPDDRCGVARFERRNVG